MANNRQTEIVSGDIFFQDGNYKKRLNTKTASNTTKTGLTINLKDYTEGEAWENVSITYGVVSIEQYSTETIKSTSVEIKYLSSDKNTFQFIGYVNGRNIGTSMTVSWFAREEIIDVGGSKFVTPEKASSVHTYTYTFPSKVSKILNISTNTGMIESYNISSDKRSITVKLKSGSKYKTYQKVYEKVSNGMAGSYVPASSFFINASYYVNSVVGNANYSGTIKLISNTTTVQPWVNNGSQFVYTTQTVLKTVGFGYSVNQVVNSSSDANANYRTIITSVVQTSSTQYHKTATIYAVNQKATILRNCKWSGTLYCDTFVYSVNVSYIIDNSVVKLSPVALGSAEFLYDISDNELYKGIIPENITLTNKRLMNDKYYMYATKKENLNEF